MPRGRKKTPVNPIEEIEHIDQKIENIQRQIAGLKQKRKEIISKADDTAKKKVLEAFEKSGLSAEEFLALLSSQ